MGPEVELERTQVNDTEEQGVGQARDAGSPGLDRKGGESEADQDNKVAFAMLDQLKDFSENFLEVEDGEMNEFMSKMIVHWEQVNKENLSYLYEGYGMSELECELGLIEKRQQQYTGCLEKEEVQLDSGMFH
ncbi:hypothetical protein P4O66_022545, partial [Electrophorus voltai]